jgi:hypothetical protein
MTIHPLPPQAYTKDTLIKAYEWLQTQSDSIKQIATSPDVLVSLYMKAQMQGEDALHRPSIKNFKHDLKNLADMMSEWGPSQAHMTATSHSGSSMAVSQATHTETRVSNSVSTTKEIPALDPAFRDKVREIQHLFGLSREAEALSLLINIGYHHAKRLMS